MQRALASRDVGRFGRAALCLVFVAWSVGLAACAHRPPNAPQPPAAPPQPEPQPPAPPQPSPPSPPPGTSPPEPSAPPVTRVRQGTASWYGPGFQGRTTASGERFDENALTAAHETLALGTRVRVTNLRNGRNVVVRINDRGPAYPDRILDLSRAAAAELGMIRPGKVPVRIEVLGATPQPLGLE